MLKYIALLLMIVDHVAYVFQDYFPTDLYWGMRVLGRISFPVFVYYIVLGLSRTSSLNRYLSRLFIFAVISEVVKRFFVEFHVDYVNVIFSLFLYGLFHVLFTEKLSKSPILNYSLLLPLVIITPLTEYGYSGLLVFIFISLVHYKVNVYKKIAASLLMIVAFIPEFIFNQHLGSYIQVFSLFAGMLMFTPSLDKRVLSPKIEKWMFYLVYPLQWLILGLMLRLLT